MAMSTLDSNGIQNLISHSGTNKLSSVHPKYLISDEERQSLKQVYPLSYVPTIDLAQLDGPSRALAIEKLREACKEYGFFEVVNHGVPRALIEDMMKIGEEFFKLPVEDKIHLYSNDYHKKTRVSTSFNVGKENKPNWRDYLRHPCFPLEDHIGTWPTKPSSYRNRTQTFFASSINREVAAKYATAIREMTLKLLEAISESLELERDHIAKTLGKHIQTMQINYYPPCPNPDLTMALAAHTDPSCVTVVQHDQVIGLQVMKNGCWFDVPSPHDSFFVNTADILQVISNGKYKSVVHRAITNSKKPRMSIPTFYGASYEAVIEPAASLVTANEHGALYVPFRYQEYLDHFYTQNLVTTTLQHFEAAGGK